MQRYERCLRCNRKLKTEEAKLLGFGKICWEKYSKDQQYMDLFSELSNDIFSKKEENLGKEGDRYAIK